jgi:hypothetical protein
MVCPKKAHEDHELSEKMVGRGRLPGLSTQPHLVVIFLQALQICLAVLLG